MRGSVVTDPGFAGDLHVRPLERRGDPEARAGPGAGPRRRSVAGRQGDPAAVPDQPGKAGRDDGGGGPGDQGDPRRTSSRSSTTAVTYSATRPSPSATGIAMYEAFKRVRAPDGDAGDDRRARGGHGPDRRRQDVQGRGRCGSAARCFTRPPPTLQEKTRGPGQADLGGDGRGQVPRPVQGLRGGRAQAARTARRTGCGSSGCKGGKRIVRLPGMDRRRPESPRSYLRAAAGRGYDALAARGALLDLRARRRGSRCKGFRGRPWELCLNDECPSMVEMRAEARRARGRARGEGGRRSDGADEVAGRRRRPPRAEANGASAAGPARRRRRRSGPAARRLARRG